MLTEPASTSPEHQVVHRQFTMRWTHGCAYTGIHAASDDDMTRWQIDTWAQVLEEVLPQLGPAYVTVIDTTAIGVIPRGLWIALVGVTKNMSRQPLRRALLTAEGSAGDNQAEAVELITAGSVRAFRPRQLEAMIEWLAGAGTIDSQRLRELLS